MGQYITKLKGGVSISIDGDGLITKSATWMVIADGQNSYAVWKALEADALSFAGNVGDSWKEPVQDTGGRECSTYSSSTAFRVTDIAINCVDRLVYEVTFSAQQNLTVMKKIGNIDVDIDNLNQKTVSIAYQVDLATGSNDEVKALFHTPGSSVVVFSGDTYLIDNASYNHVTNTRYAITVTLRDMGVMRIGRPKFNKDAFNQKTASISWRYSASAYASLVLPDSGSDASDWLGIPNSGYLVTSVSSEPDGLLGYTVTVESKYVSDTVVKTDESYNLNTDYAFDTEAAVESSVIVTKQATKEGASAYKEMIGQEAESLGYPGLTIASVDVSETGRGDYEVRLNLTDDEYTPNPRRLFQNTQNYLKNQVDVSIGYTELVLEPIHLGYVKGISDIDWVAINNPPKTTFMYDLDVKSLQEINAAWTDEEILAAIRSGKIGFSWVFRVYGADNRVMSKAEIAALSSVSQVSSIRLQDYNYAQPFQKTSDGISVRNMYFVPWKAKDSAILYPVKSYRDNYPTFGGNDMPMLKKWIGKKIPIVECTVGKHYIGRAAKVIRNWEHQFFTDAVAELDLKGISSYKRVNLSLDEVVDNKGKIWTKVTQTLHGLRGWYWNHDYNDGELM